MQFSYVAYTLDKGLQKGLIAARTEQDARSQIQSQGYKVLRLSTAKKMPSMEELFPSLFKVGTPELLRFCRQTATMLESGANLLRCLDIIQDDTKNRVMRRTLGDIKETLDEGGSLSSALAEHPKVFNSLFVKVVEVGEHTGQLAPALLQLAETIQKEHEAKKKAMTTLMYPVAIIGMSFVTLAILMFIAMPPLLKVFEQLGSDVPFMTRVAVQSFGALRDNFINMTLGVMGLVVLVALLRRRENFRYAMDKAMLRVPIVSSLLLALDLARFSRTMTMLLDAGVSLAGALQLTKHTVRNQAIGRSFADAEVSLLSGHTMGKALKEHNVTPGMFNQLVMIGEESNSLQSTMKDAAEAYQKEFEDKMNSLLGMLEPISTVVVALIVGFIAFSMFTPIYSGLNAVN